MRKIIFGAGYECQKLLSHIKEHIAFIVDNDWKKWGTSVLGVTIKSPEEIREDDEIYIATSPVYAQDIANSLLRRGVHNFWMARSLMTYSLKNCNEDIYSLKNKYCGRSCFIIGTGPSLRVSDLEQIEKAGIYSFASNKIFKIFKQTKWRPDFYCAFDREFISQYLEEICCIRAKGLFINDVFDYPGCKHLKREKLNKKNTYLFTSGFDSYISDKGELIPIFSEDASFFVNEGMTVTYAMMQLAYFMGIKEMYLLGIDFSYGDTTGLDSGKNDHFCKDYIKKGEIVNPPDLKTNLLAYQEAERFSRNHDFRIYNATRGGRLEVFERVDFDKLME